MKLISFTTTRNDADRARFRRITRLLIIYWIVVSLLGFGLPRGEQLAGVQQLVHLLIGNLAFVQRASASSFDPAFVEVFSFGCILTSLVLTAVSVFWIRGSHVTFDDWLAKSLTVAAAALMWAMAWATLFIGPSELSLANGRGAAYLYLGISSRLGAVFVLGAFWGFAQFFFFLGARVALVSPVR